MVLTILQWNARSLIANGQEFKGYINDSLDNPHLICIQETWLKPQLDFVIVGYLSVRKDRENGTGGGVAIFVREDIQFRSVEIGKEELVVIEMWIGGKSVMMVNFYNPCKRLDLASLVEVSNNLQGSVVWTGDFNAHSTLWGCADTDVNGQVVEDFLEESGLVCVNDGQGTRYNCTNNTESALDLTLVSDNLAGVCSWNVLQESTLGSDHYPILVKIGIEPCVRDRCKEKRWKLEGANWVNFSKLTSGKCAMLSIDHGMNIDEINHELVEVVIESAKQSIPMRSGNIRKKSVPWWNDNCTKAIRDRNRAFRQLKLHHTLSVLIEYNKARAVVRKVVKSAKKSHWREYCNSIGRETQISEVWRVLKKMSGVSQSFRMPPLKRGVEVLTSDLDKAELLAKSLAAVHSSANLSVEDRQSRECLLLRYSGGLGKKTTQMMGMDSPFTLFELKNVVDSTRKTAPGKDLVCYSMLAHMEDDALSVVLKLFNQIWDVGYIPVSWKESVIVPLLKPGKEPTNPLSYRPIALTSHLGKTMERMVTKRLEYYMEGKGLLSPYQSGFRKGRNTMDGILCLESEIRKAQTNKEFVMAVFFDIEKAYDMLWREGLLIKLGKLGVRGKLFNWVRSFMSGRSIRVKVGNQYSREYPVENGVPQGSVCSPILFSIMINDIFESVGDGLGKSLFADDGALWVRGRNFEYVQAKLQAAITKVEEWSKTWGFKLSVSKTQCICFYRRHKALTLKLYGQVIEQVTVVRFLGVFLDEALTWKQHIDKVKEKCKKVNNLLRCLVGRDWGADGTALNNIYVALMRSRLDYGCIAYMSAALSHLKKLDVEHSRALRICCGAFKSSPVAAVQVIMGEQPLFIRRIKLLLSYWSGLQSHNDSHPVKKVLLDCWEHNERHCTSFGWLGNSLADHAGLANQQYVSLSMVNDLPPWTFSCPVIDFSMHGCVKKNNSMRTAVEVQAYIDNKYKGKLLIYTDGSKDPTTGRAGAAVYVPKYRIGIVKRATDNLSVYVVEILAILLALKWVINSADTDVVILSDSWAALTSVKSVRSCRLDLILEIHRLLIVLRNMNKCVQFAWIPAHVGLEGNEDVDILAKRSLKAAEVDLDVCLGKAEAKAIIKNYCNKRWQEYWDTQEVGRSLHELQREVGKCIIMGRNRTEVVVMTRLRIGHSGLNESLYRIGKHATGNCDKCGMVENVKHVLLDCKEYEQERQKVIAAADKAKMPFNICSVTSSVLFKVVIKYLKETGLMERM